MLLGRSKYGRMHRNNERRHLLFFAVDVRLLVESLNAIMKNAELLAGTEERLVEKLILRRLSVCVHVP